MQQLILREYKTVIRCNSAAHLSLGVRQGAELDGVRRQLGLLGKNRKEKGRQVLQEKIFARTKKRTTTIPAGSSSKPTLPSIPGPRHRAQVDVDPNKSQSRPREGPFLPHLPRPARPARHSPNEFELHSIVEILNLKKKELHSLSEQKPDMVMTRTHRSPPGKNMRIPKDMPMTIKSYQDEQGREGTVYRPPRQIVVVVPSVALESPRKAVKPTQLVMVDNKAADEKPHAMTTQSDSLGRLTGRYLTRRPSQEHRAGHFNNFRQYLKRSKSRKAAPLGPAPSASMQDKKVLNVSGRKSIPTLPVIPSIRRDDEIQTVMGENGVVLNGDLSGVSSEDTSVSGQSELGKVFSNSSSSKSSFETAWNHNSHSIRVKRLSNPQQQQKMMMKVKDRQGRDSGNESSDSLDGLKDGSTTEEHVSRARWSPKQKRYVVDKSHISSHMVSKNGYSVAKRYFDRQDREKTRSSLPSGPDQDYLTRTINGNANKGQPGNHIVYVERTHSIRRRRGSGENVANHAQIRQQQQRPLGQISGHRNPPPSPADPDYRVNVKRQGVENSRPDSGRATQNSDSTGLSHRTDSSGVHSEVPVRKQPMKAPAIWDETFTMRVTEDDSSPSSAESDSESMPKPITMISINQSEQPTNAQTASQETADMYKSGYGRTQDIDNRSLLSVPDSESLRAYTPMPGRVLTDADDTESTSTISVPKITMTCATPLPPRATPSTSPPPNDGLRLFVSDIERVGGVINR